MSDARMMRRSEVLKLTGLSTSTLYRFMEAGTFPRPIKLGQRAVAWIESEVHEWVAGRVAAGDVDVIQASPVPASQRVAPPESEPIKVRSGAICGVYFLMRDGCVIYVGSSKNVLGRIGAHVERINFDSARVIPCENVASAMEVEARWIALLQPPYNGWKDKAGVRRLCAPTADIVNRARLKESSTKD